MLGSRTVVGSSFFLRSSLWVVSVLCFLKCDVVGGRRFVGLFLILFVVLGF